ncbi:hypothetical protein TraAM80_02016 [Trypanosoma rangeli]|uniref:Uncharacterized protein n=1 Tax=Trypanosoma rangeli TaxID=5698 RepID=A0A422NW37_TRYRA|nr:uncharacterized protein TraAM80_02016 [Trypanosoma rangeli]RNF09661.1 hypothetical protein TraAM80_02016 [Trypanosoma rangeli]|eukprot:RNF09661.1 hypothetical protein TraAM80_02016 [Trypanosoma rangeli]
MLLLSGLYFDARMARSDTEASRLTEAELAQVMRRRQEGKELRTLLGNLMRDNAQLQRAADRSAAMTRGLPRRQAGPLRSLTGLRQRSASLAGEMEALKNFPARVDQRVSFMRCVGGVGFGCLAAGGIAALTPSRRGSASCGGSTNGGGGAGASLLQQEQQRSRRDTVSGGREGG